MLRKLLHQVNAICRGSSARVALHYNNTPFKRPQIHPTQRTRLRVVVLICRLFFASGFGGWVFGRVWCPRSGQASTPQGQSIGLVVSLGVPACLVCGVLFLYLFGASCSRLIGRTAVCCLLKRKSYHYRATLEDGGCKSTARTEALTG